VLVVLIDIKDGYKVFIKFLLENKVMVYLGRISYGLYIYHLFMMPIYFRLLRRYLGNDATPIGYFFIYLVMNIILASVSWYLVEKPINNLKKYFNY
jgi:peptidoglycan/LPS O-acetylase OafA/YrhL